MVQLLLIGIAAGAASALLVVSLASLSPFALLLALLAPLPILIAGIGWHHTAGMIAALVAAIAFALVFSLVLQIGFLGVFAAFLAILGLPAWWLSYLALLARPDAQGELEWYPVGRLVVWAAVLGLSVSAIVVIYFAGDVDAFHAAVRRLLEQVSVPTKVRLRVSRTSEQVVDVALTVLPISAMLCTLAYLANLWLAGRIAKVSDRLRRPWPDLAGLRFPPLVAGGLMATMVVGLVSGLTGVVASLLAGTLLLAFAVLGLAIVHKITDGRSGRTFVLVFLYAAIVFIGWPILALMLLGLGDAVFDIREHFAVKRGPPAQT
jgi:hypothetical protein